MGAAASPPKRVTRSRAAAAAASSPSHPAAAPQGVSKRAATTKATSKSSTAAAKAASKPSTAATKAISKTSTAATKATSKASTKSTARTASAKGKTATSSNTNPAAVAKAAAKTSTSTARTSSQKRKTRDYDDDEDDLSKDTDETMAPPAAKKARGTVKKTDVTNPTSTSTSTTTSTSTSTSATSTSTTSTTTRAPRGRSKQTPTSDSVPTAEEAKPKALRSRAKKSAAAPAEKKIPATKIVKNTVRGRATKKEEPATKVVKKTARGRAAKNEEEGTIHTNDYTTEPTPGLKSAVSRPTSRVTGVAKKTVTFEESMKENTETSATGMRARPVRNGAAVGRTTRASVKAASFDEKKEKTPLSPKKDSQNLSLARDTGSDDELATYEKTPLKPLMKSPVKPPNGAPKIQLPAPEKAHDENSPQPVETARASVLTSPARRPPVSPVKDTFKSPAKRVDAIPPLILPSTRVETQGTSQSPSKPSMLQSPAKRTQIPIQSFQKDPFDQNLARSPSKLSFLHTPAKRPSSPLRLPGTTPMASGDDVELESPDQLSFPGRLSAVLPRHADPVLKENPSQLSESQDIPREDSSASSPTANPTTPEQSPIPSFPCQVLEKLPESEVKAAVAKVVDRAHRSVSRNSQYRFTPVRRNTSQLDVTPSGGRSALKAYLQQQKAFKQANATEELSTIAEKDGKADSSPLKLGPEQKTPVQGTTADEFSPFSPLDEKDFPVMQGSPAVLTATSSAAEDSPSKGFFDEEMRIRAETEAAMEAALEADLNAQFPEFNEEVGITDEDLKLQSEADEMSMLQSDGVSQMPDDSISEASQEYGDENAMPVDPSLMGSSIRAGTKRPAPETPARPLIQTRLLTTTVKVPVKSADDLPVHVNKRHCSSASKVQWLGNQHGAEQNSQSHLDPSDLPLTTPSKSMGTPARTARADLNPQLLRGVVALVDVHTEEGGDAGQVFVDLLHQMGARCVSRWQWNPGYTKPTPASVGITHVVFKNGSVRTREKIEMSNGVVKGVGVGWVLDCERQNHWLEEKEYQLPDEVPRGGHNRRKSMEPKSIINENGTILTPMRKSSGAPHDPRTLPNNYMSRRESAVWVRTPSDHDDEEDAPGERDDWLSNAPALTPVPKTPAPEAVAQFAMDISPGTPTTVSQAGYSPERHEELMTRSCPANRFAMAPRPFVRSARHDVIRPRTDEDLDRQLTELRRKSMQFAPKVGSPLSKAWKE